MTKKIRFGFKGKKQLPLFMIWVEEWETGMYLTLMLCLTACVGLVYSKMSETAYRFIFFEVDTENSDLQSVLIL